MAGAKPIPEGFHTLTPHMIVKGAAEAIEFYKRAFGAEEIVRMPGPGGMVMHSELRIGDSPLMVNDEFPDVGVRGPASIGGSPVTLHLYVEDVDALMERAEKAGAKITMPAQDTFWGDRYGRLEDPFGHQWSLATRTENLTADEIRRRAALEFR
jgi:uncharacterized glyoxalase superfamily protein PhnB